MNLYYSMLSTEEPLRWRIQDTAATGKLYGGEMEAKALMKAEIV